MKLESRDPYYFTAAGVKKIEEMRNATYMGYWCGKTKEGGWAERPLDVFYQPDPDVEKGHTNYFGLIVKGGQVLITDASSCFSEPMSGVLENDTIYVSRYRHDFVQTPGGKIIDGGRDYTKTNAGVGIVTVTVNGDQFEFALSEIDDVRQDQQV